jgi:hypothetical protein
VCIQICVPEMAQTQIGREFVCDLQEHEYFIGDIKFKYTNN